MSEAKESVRESLDGLLDISEINREIRNLAGTAPSGKETAGDGGSEILAQKEIRYVSVGEQRRRKRRRRLIVFLLIIALLGGFFVGVPYTLREAGRKSLLAHENTEGIAAPEEAEVTEGGRYVTYKGHRYVRNDSIISILCLGVDRDEKMEAKAETLVAGEQGQADTIFVAALDSGTGELTLINISRDSMVDVDLYNTEGEYAGVEEMQICLAYGYGDGRAKSCENTARSVSRLLYGIPMDAYASLDIPAISVLNDAVGGVPVTVLEDLSSRDGALVKGAHLILNGEQARIYVRSRDHQSTEANNSRMQRQRQYLTSFLQKLFASARKNLSVILSLYQASQTYMVTDIGIPQVTYLASLALTHDFTERSIVTVPGTAEQGEEYVEFRVDDEALYQIILDTYYQEIDEEGNLVGKHGSGERKPGEKPASEADSTPETEEISGAEEPVRVSEDENTAGTPEEPSDESQNPDRDITVDTQVLH